MTNIYKIRGCQGSQRGHLVDSELTHAQAKKTATRLNQENADRLGLTYRAYCLRSMGGEGWHYAQSEYNFVNS